MTITPSWDTGTDFPVPGAPAGYEGLHYGTRFKATIPVPNGLYTVTMSFLETSVQTVGARIFHVSINDTPVLWRFDLFASAGFMVPAQRSVPVTVTNGQMVFVFEADVRFAVISSIEIESEADRLLNV